jgi:hypothetical protein
LLFPRSTDWGSLFLGFSDWDSPFLMSNQ